ncbi:MAG: glycosyltransferase family 2 protein [Pirellulales bacterium]
MPALAISTQTCSGVVVIIPALNEEESLPRVLADLPHAVDVIVVDNGSTDTTADVAGSGGATVLREPVRGYGSACLRGLQHVEQSIRAGDSAPRVIAFLDADYSDHPELLLSLVEPILSGDADLVLGSRMLGKREPGAMPPQAVFGNRLACFLMHILFRARYTDLGPFRAIDYSALRELNMRDRGFGWTVEMQIKAARQGLRIVELPVPYRRRIGKSKISGTLLGSFRAGYTILYLIGKHALLSRPWFRSQEVCAP